MGQGMLSLSFYKVTHDMSMKKIILVKYQK